MWQSDDVMVHNMRIRKFLIDQKFLKSLPLKKFFSDSDEVEEESNEDDDDIDSDQVPLFVNSKLLLKNNSNNMFYILNEFVFNWESSQDEVTQRIWD